LWRTSIKELKINQEISADPVFLIDEDGKSQGVVSLDQALYLASEKGYDLALVNEKASPPICKLMDYGKYLYSQTKQVAKQKAKSHGPELKEVRFSIKIDQHDLDFKTNLVKKFLDRGDKVKISVQLKGREMMFQDKVNSLIEKVKNKAGGTFEKPASPNASQGRPIQKLGSRFFATITKGKDETKDK